MSLHLKPLDQQVVVITGASSGIGLATAFAAAQAGAHVVLAARSARTLAEIQRQLGERAITVEADVSDLDFFHAPASVAVVGASDDPEKIGGRPLRYLREFGYAGTVVAVNPRRDSVQGLATVPTLADLVEEGTHPILLNRLYGADIPTVVVMSSGERMRLACDVDFQRR